MLWVVVAVVFVAGGIFTIALRSRLTNVAVTSATPSALASNPDLDPGSSLPHKVAPSFTLVDQFGRKVSLSAFRGRVVIMAFVDSQCTTICPLTTASMSLARRMLGAAGRRVALVGVDANPQATSVADVRAYSESHGLMHDWTFLTGTPRQLAAVWRAYGIYVQVVHGLIDHTPALYVLDTRGRERRIYMTQMAYAAINQQAQILAEEASRLLPSHPKVHSDLSYTTVPGIEPNRAASLAAVNSLPVRLQPGRPRVVLFFATWLSQTSNLRSQLAGLNDYVSLAKRDGLPPLVAVDELPTEVSSQAVRSYARSLPAPMYPIALDTAGRVADGYGVQDLPWFAVVSANGKVVGSHDGWLTPTELAIQVRRVLNKRSGATRPTSASTSVAGSVASYFHVDAAQHLMRLTMIAGLKNGGFDLDGTAHGFLSVRVPLHWLVQITLENRSTLPNSLAVVRPGSSTVAFPGAGTPLKDLKYGLRKGAVRSFTFVPTAVGTYRITSLVPGHEASGMWATLIVTKGGRPSVRW
jgi:cytochrome oxidase Cu insertion factor (SCO1/SenC/PrrC family)